METSNIILAIETGGATAVGGLTFLIVYTTFKQLKNEVIQEFSRRFMFTTALLVFYVSYLMVYQIILEQTALYTYILYILLASVFLSVIWSALQFEKIADKYGFDTEDKVKRMEEQEDLN